jgi:hypothetical protein
MKGQAGPKLECHNYRGILHLNVNYTIFTNLLTRYFEPYVDVIIVVYRCGFRKCRSNNEQKFFLKMILEKPREYKLDIHQLYIDYKQAYDAINRAEQVEIMKGFSVPMKLVRLVKMT